MYDDGSHDEREPSPERRRGRSAAERVDSTGEGADRLPVLGRRLGRAARDATRRGHAVIEVGSLSPPALTELMRTLGEPMFTPGEHPHPEDPFVFVVTNRERDTPPKSVFHSDTSYVARPPSFTALLGVEIPVAGGETVFVDQFEAFDAADEFLKSSLDGVEFLHVASRVSDPSAAGDGAWHPAIRRHPSCDRPALYVSARERLVAARRKGERLSDEEAEALIARACAQATRGAAEYRHVWAAGQLLLTDNRSTLHRADHAAVSGVRTLHRVMVRGEVPIMH